jgi:hypothetical protein
MLFLLLSWKRYHVGAAPLAENVMAAITATIVVTLHDSDPPWQDKGGLR